MNYGCRIIRLTVPGGAGNPVNVVAGYDNLETYRDDPHYLGGIVGRYANRIRNGQFSIDGQTFHVTPNEGDHHLHGGVRGFDRRFWDVDTVQRDGFKGVVMTRHSPRGEEGYPGNLVATVHYLIPDTARELHVTCEARTDAPTVVSLAQHSYFNLTGEFDRNVMDYSLRLHADTYLPIDADKLPTGEIAPVAGNAMDFRNGRRIGEIFRRSDTQVRRAGGCDHCFLINGRSGTMRPVAVLTDPFSDRSMEVLTTAPGVQVYTANHLDGTTVLQGGKAFARHGAICFETQRLPDAPNHESFGDVVLRPGETYRSVTVYRFS